MKLSIGGLRSVAASEFPGDDKASPSSARKREAFRTRSQPLERALSPAHHGPLGTADAPRTAGPFHFPPSLSTFPRLAFSARRFHAECKTMQLSLLKSKI